MKTIIKTNSISKEYKTGESCQYLTLRDNLARIFSLKKKQIKKDSFLALDDVSFEIKQGDVVGIIGKNGAGKTTLLKILSRITPPTKGVIEIEGRVGSLLEVGTGFHPELTGRENVFFNGAILGMKHKEIKDSFDEIVEFSGVKDFIDMPVKRYSGGMRLRLAFAVAAHLRTEVLFIDEVLAVGDMAFQEKCMGKMGAISKEGRTILFVSHNMQAIMALCNRAIVLNKGKIVFNGETKNAIEEYTKLNTRIDTIKSLVECPRRDGNGIVKFYFFEYKDYQGKTIDSPIFGETCRIRLTLFAKQKIKSPIRISIAVSDMFGFRITMFDTAMTGFKIEELAEEYFIVECCIPKFPLVSGLYSLNFYVEVKGEIADWIVGEKEMLVQEGDFYKAGTVFPKEHVKFAIEHNWEIL